MAEPSQLIECRTIFTPATGFIRRGGFDWTCNPYVGCPFACSYCYAMFLPQNRRPKEDWGKWLLAKRNAAEVAQRQAPKVAGQAVYLSSVTDPYLPIERSLKLTRGILEALIPHRPRLVVQTRGPLVTRDVDLLRQFGTVRVNVTISTDSEAAWKTFEPKSPPLERRWRALEELKAAGLPIGVCVTPMLPLDQPSAFVERLLKLAPDALVTQWFHASAGSFGADTGAKLRQALECSAWREEDYRQVVEALRRRREVFEGEAGFFPPPAPE